MLKIKQDKNGQIGETITWVVATIIIVLVLAISIFISSFYAEKFKRIQEPYFQTADIPASKSLFSYLLTWDSEGKKVYSQIKEDGSFNDFNGNFAVKVFRGLYQKDYLNNPNNIWLGIVVNTAENANGKPCASEPKFCILLSIGNNFFGERPIGSKNTEEGYHTIPYTSEKIKLNETHSIELSLTGK